MLSGRTLCTVITLMMYQIVVTAPLIQKVTNKTDFGFAVVKHTDDSSCSLRGKSIIIQPKSEFVHEFLLELGDPSLVLRPVFYQHPKTKKIVWLTNKNFDYNPSLIESAYLLFKSSKHKDQNKRHQKSERAYKKALDHWFETWVGQDICVVPHQVEMLGYLRDSSRILIYNKDHKHEEWLSFSKGIFSKLVLEVELHQYKQQGIVGKLIVLHGEGGVCSDGIVERLYS